VYVLSGDEKVMEEFLSHSIQNEALFEGRKGRNEERVEGGRWRVESKDMTSWKVKK
jgi:hypothetical protein